MNDSSNGRGALPTLALVAALLCGLGVLAFLGLRWAQHSRNNGERTVVTKGFTQKRVTSDWATWTAELTARSPQMEPGYQKIEDDSQTVANYLRGMKVADDAVALQGISITPKYKSKEEGMGNTNEIEAFELKRTVSLQSKDVQLVDRISKEITSLIKQGVEIKSLPAKYYYTNIEDLKIEMLAEAARDAKNKAERIAASSEARLGGLFSAQQGVFQVTPVYSFEVSDEGSFDTTSIEKTVRAIVTSRFTVR